MRAWKALRFIFTGVDPEPKAERPELTSIENQTIMVHLLERVAQAQKSALQGVIDAWNDQTDQLMLTNRELRKENLKLRTELEELRRENLMLKREAT